MIADRDLETKEKDPDGSKTQFGAELQNLLKLFGALVDGRLISPPTIPDQVKNTEVVIY